MAFLHSLVKARSARGLGWYAPAELGAAAPHDISYVLPVNDDHRYYPAYTCEILRGNDNPVIETYLLEQHGEGSFILRLENQQVWFAVAPVSSKYRLLPYRGKLEHPDFGSRFVEIEPASIELLDFLYDHDEMWIIGCEPFTHYRNLRVSDSFHQVRQ